MNQPRKDAYRYVLYWAMLDIRPLAWYRFHWWNPFRWRWNIRRIRYAGDLADCLHNLAMFASVEFEGFQEDWFWKELESLESRFPEFSPSRFRSVFDRRLEELNARLTQ